MREKKKERQIDRQTEIRREKARVEIERVEKREGYGDSEGKRGKKTKRY